MDDRLTAVVLSPLVPSPPGRGLLPHATSKEWVRGFGSISTAGNPLTPTLSQPKSGLPDFGHFKCRTRASPSSGGERERTEFVAHSCTACNAVV
jgi:hypothetical protein